MEMASTHRRGPWSQSEDVLLMNLVSRQGGANNWVNISRTLQSRTPKQCRERYHQNLKPTLKHDPITPEEGAMIVEWVRTGGKRWAEISRRLPGRSDNAVKNWWNGNQNRRKRSDRRRTHHDGSTPHPHFDDSRYLQHEAPGSHYHARHSLSIQPGLDQYGRPALLTPTSPGYSHSYGGYHGDMSSPGSTIGASPRSDAMDPDASTHSDSASSYTTASPFPGVLQLPPLNCDTTQPRSLPGVGSLLHHGARADPERSPALRLPPIGQSPVHHLPTAPSSPMGSALYTPHAHHSISHQKDKDERMSLNKIM